MAPKLHYLTVKISGFGKTFTTQALVDTWCAKTAMSNNFFGIINHINNFVIAPSLNVKIQTCDGTNHSITGTTHITILVGDSQFPIDLNVLVIPNLADDFLMGLDLLASKIIEKMTPEYIFIKGRDGSCVIENFRTVTFPMNQLKIPDMEIQPLETKHLHWCDPSSINTDVLRCKSLLPNLIVNENPKLNDSVIKVTVTNILNVKLTPPKHHRNIMRLEKCSFP